MPLHINDENLCPTISSPDGRITITERPRSEFTTLSYTVHSIEIAILVRESVDLRESLLQSPRPPASRVIKLRNDLRRKFDAFSAGLPFHFQIGSEVGLAPDDLSGPLVAVPVHRWMLHQQLWTLFLRFHRANLSSPDERAACRLYAKNIIDTGERIRRWCIVCGSLSLGDAQLFSAAAILIIDLLLPLDPNAGDLQDMRRENLEKVDAALTLFNDRDHAATQPELHGMPWRRRFLDHQLGRVKVSANRCIITLEALLKLEAEQHGDQPTDKKAKRPAKGAAKKSLKDKIFDVLEPLKYLIPKDMSFFFPKSSDFQDPDVLPVLSNQPGSRFWQDVALSVSPRTPAATGFFPASVDWETLIDWLPPSPNQAEMNLLDSYDCVGLSQMDGNTDGCDPIIDLDTL